MSAPLDVLARVGSFMANEGHGKTDFVCTLRNDFTEARAAVAELVEAANDIPVEYDFHGKPASPELARFVAALAKFGGAA